MVYLIFKGNDWAGKTQSYGRKTVYRSQEEILHEKIEKGTVTDSDIATIQKNGGDVMNHLLTKENEQRKKIKDMKREWGNTFDGIDNSGALYKDIPLDKLET